MLPTLVLTIRFKGFRPHLAHLNPTNTGSPALRRTLWQSRTKCARARPSNGIVPHDANTGDVRLRASARMERMTEKQVAKNTIEKLAIVVVTYRRQQLLATLFESIEKLTVAPWRIIVVDNEHSEATQGMVDDFREAVTAQVGQYHRRPVGQRKPVWCTRRNPTTSAAQAASPQV